MILISSRIVFTFSDVTDSGKQVVAVVLIIFMILILLRSLGEKYYRRLNHNEPILITPGLINSLDPQVRADLGNTLLEYLIDRRRGMQIDYDFVARSKVGHSLLQRQNRSKCPTSETSLPPFAHVGISIESLGDIGQLKPGSKGND
jgi:hypothetical protein